GEYPSDGFQAPGRQPGRTIEHRRHVGSPRIRIVNRPALVVDHRDMLTRDDTRLERIDGLREPVAQVMRLTEQARSRPFADAHSCRKLRDQRALPDVRALTLRRTRSG